MLLPLRLMSVVNTPELLAVTLPRLTLPLNNSTAALASAVPLMVRLVVCLVTLSVLETPVSSAAAKSRLVGALGATVSTLILTVPALDTLPAASVAVALNEFTPWLKPVTLAVNWPVASAVPVAMVAPAAFFTTTVLPASAATEIACVVLVANPPVKADVSVTAGAPGVTVSTVMVKGKDAPDALPAASVALAVTLYAVELPLRLMSVVNKPALLAVTLPRLTLPLNNSTVALAWALPVMVRLVV